jgi:N-acetylglucosamine-6-phosphate deacetylase
VSRGAKAFDARGLYVAAGFIDLHVWGEPQRVAREAVRHGTTAFLTTLGPAAEAALVREVAERARVRTAGAECAGVHLEGPFLNPARGGVLPRRGMRAPTVRELKRLWRAANGRVRLVTLAPELRGAREAVAWCRRHRIVVSLGHSDAGATIARRAVDAGAAAVTHAFNGMRPWHHRQPSLLDVALTDPRLTAMVIADGVHVSATALQLLLRAKGAERIALVTDSVRGQAASWALRWRGGAYVDRRGVLAGSGLTMIDAVRNMVRLGGATLPEAARMASEVPARLLGLWRERGSLDVGKRADLVVFDQQFRVQLTLVNGDIAYQRRM